MSSIPRPIPTNLILGFLGVGKTTAILDLLRQKPEGETWAVLVNEFGEVGIDGAILETEGAVVREVPGGKAKPSLKGVWVTFLALSRAWITCSASTSPRNARVR